MARKQQRSIQCHVWLLHIIVFFDSKHLILPCMEVEVLCDDATGILFVGYTRLINIAIVDKETNDEDTILIHLNLRHITNKNRDVVVAYDNLLDSPLAMIIGDHTVYTSTGTPGERGASFSIHTMGVLALSALTLYVGYRARGEPIKLTLTGDVSGGLRTLGVLRVARVALSGMLSGYPEMDTTEAEQSIFRIQNRSHATTTSNHIEIGERGKGNTRIIGAECLDIDGTERMRVTNDGCVLNGSIKTRLGLGDSVTVHSMVSDSDVYSVDSTGNVFATSYTSLSDSRMKCNITPLRRQNCLRDVMKLKCYSYNFCVGDALLHHGLLADEVACVIPSIVRGGDAGHIRHVAYDEIIPFLVGAVQTLHIMLIWGVLLVCLVFIGVVLMMRFGSQIPRVQCESDSL
jgi:hypothetical protein